MSNRGISWVGTISEDLADRGPAAFARRKLEKQDHLFAHRSALFYTPTENIPAKHVGSGPLDVMLPITSPDYTDLAEIRAYGSPRFWVDLIQRQTGKLRWTPISPARVVFIRYDSFTIRQDHLAIGTKGLLDALKLRTTGRRDRLYLHYFGAILDDGPGFVDITWEQEIVAHPKDAGVRIQVVQK
ncbi:hypothetical protein EI77_00887 [Prosthecobacter fusiformis]|uniref:Uncharacterized protein n=1 Tax=Prosthecobacter fusiformis TaxID=48464 RepID=A0A4R7STG9_9BACT|nr:hypothetical protein [Prosthecobacter fusiformis]TDU81577.1 hypothetical protein EI77_00887 [Prosthecobacter fusiformis]